MVSPQDWTDWLRSPVTQAVREILQKKQDDAVKSHIGMGLSDMTVEQCGMEYLCMRNYLAGVGEFLDSDGLLDALAAEVPNEN